MRSKVFVFTVLVSVVSAGFYWWPVYGFYSHNKGWPHGPLGWLELPRESPQQQSVDLPEFEHSGTRALAILSKHRSSLQAPAMTAAVAIDGKRVWAGAVGWADIKNKIPATLDTQFRIGSTSKAITGTALARMVQAGLIDLDQPLASLTAAPINPQWRSITPRQLASHLAGIPHYKQTKDPEGVSTFIRLQSHYENVEEALALFDETPLLFAPGEDFHYSSLGTVLLSSLMQRASGTRYQQWVQDQVFMPLQMMSTYPERESNQLATPYWRNEAVNPSKLRKWRDVDLSHRLAGGGFISTSSDLVKLGSAYFDDGFLESELVAEFWTPTRLNNGEINPQRYAIGWREGTYKGEGIESRAYHHGGVSRGGQSWLVVLADLKMVIAVNTNVRTSKFGDFARVYRDIAEVFMESGRALRNTDLE